VTLGRCPACLPCLAPDCGQVAGCMSHPSEPLCEHDWRGCEEHPCERCAETCGECHGLGAVFLYRDPETNHPVSETCTACGGTGDLTW
jgi:hypothetical protein